MKYLQPVIYRYLKWLPQPNQHPCTLPLSISLSLRNKIGHTTQPASLCVHLLIILYHKLERHHLNRSTKYVHTLHKQNQTWLTRGLPTTTYPQANTHEAWIQKLKWFESAKIRICMVCIPNTGNHVVSHITHSSHPASLWEAMPGRGLAKAQKMPLNKNSISEICLLHSSSHYYSLIPMGF